MRDREEGALPPRSMISSSDLLVNICSCVSAVKVNSEPGRNYICMIEICIRRAGRFKKIKGEETGETLFNFKISSRS